MLLPGTPLDALLFLRALGPFIAPLALGVLWLPILVLPLPLLSVLGMLLPLLRLALLLSMLLFVLGFALALLVLILVLPLLLLSALGLLVLLFWLTLLLSMLRFGLGFLVLALLLLGMVLLFALLLVLCVRRSSDSEKQRQNGCAGDTNHFHRCYLQNCSSRTLAPAQADSCCRVDRAADGCAGPEKFNSPIFLSAGGFAV